MRGSRSLSLCKAITWRIVGTLATMIIVWFMTHEWRISLYAGMFELIAKISLFYCHERFWIWIENTQDC